jgi:hypothetical protein
MAKVKVILGRDISVNVLNAAGDVETHQLKRGLNLVDKNIGEHWFVKANTVAESEVVAADDAAAQARIAELEAEIAGMKTAGPKAAVARAEKAEAERDTAVAAAAEAVARAEAAEAQAMELQGQVDALMAQIAGTQAPAA